MAGEDRALSDKLGRLRKILLATGRPAIACSGGVDSTLLLQCAVDTLGRDGVLALFVQSPLLPAEEIAFAKQVITGTGCACKVVELNPLAWPDFVENPKNRCYLCKKKIYGELTNRLPRAGCKVLLDGTNLDDLGADRPGLKAIREFGVITPLADASLTKEEIRQFSHQLDLVTWDRPSASCLATRIPAGRIITQERLTLVARCEGYLHDLGFHGCRVRLTGPGEACLEFMEKDLERFFWPEYRLFCEKKFSELGISKIVVNPRGR